jgi:uncharacterized protein
MPENQFSAPPPIEPPPAPPVAPLPNPREPARMWNMLCHLSALAGLVGIPFGNILGPLIIWQIKKNEYPSVDLHGKAALNFQITITLALLGSGLIALVLWFFCIGWLLVPLLALIALAGLVFAIIAGIKANNGEDYKYPFTFEFIK